MKDRTITVREAIAMFPALLDEPVTYGYLERKDNPDPIEKLTLHNSDTVTLQFVGDNNYRTAKLTRSAAESPAA